MNKNEKCDKSMVILASGLSEKGVSRLTSAFSKCITRTAPDSDFKLLTANEKKVSEYIKIGKRGK